MQIIKKTTRNSIGLLHRSPHLWSKSKEHERWSQEEGHLPKPKSSFKIWIRHKSRRHETSIPYLTRWTSIGCYTPAMAVVTTVWHHRLRAHRGRWSSNSSHKGNKRIPRMGSKSLSKRKRRRSYLPHAPDEPRTEAENWKEPANHRRRRWDHRHRWRRLRPKLTLDKEKTKLKGETYSYTGPPVKG
jgi:hypothetical protein